MELNATPHTLHLTNTKKFQDPNMAHTSYDTDTAQVWSVYWKPCFNTIFCWRN